MNTLIDIASITKELRLFAKERDWEQYHSPKNLAMALSVEASELLEIFQWLNEQQSFTPNDEQRIAIQHEVADVLLYLLRFSDILQLDLNACVQEKIAINKKRYPADQVKGSAQKYTAYEKKCEP